MQHAPAQQARGGGHRRRPRGPILLRVGASWNPTHVAPDLLYVRTTAASSPVVLQEARGESSQESGQAAEAGYRNRVVN